MHAHPTTTADLAGLIRPFVGTFSQIHRGDGSRIDIHGISDSIDADVRAVTAEGVKVFFYSGCELVPWAKVRGVTIRHGSAARRYEHVGARELAA